MNPTLQKAIPSQNRKEIQLLLLCARRSLDSETTEQIKLISNGMIGWPYLVKIASLHKLQFLLYRSLKIACPEAVTHPILKQLEAQYMRNVAHSLLITRQLFEIIDFLDDQGIPAMPFKGLVLSELAYGDFTLRPIGDLDLLVDRRHAFKTIDVLSRQGFRSELNLDLNQTQFCSYAAKMYSMTMYSHSRNLQLDLQWDMIGNYSIESFVLDRIRKNPHRIIMAGRTIPQPCLEMLLVYLCLHGTCDCWNVLESVSSIAGLIAGYENWDWIRIVRTADRLRCRRMVLLGIVLARDLFDTNLPPTILKAVIADPVVLNLACEVSKYFFETSELEMIEKRRSKFSSFHFRTRDCWPEKLRYAIHLLFDATDYDWKQFPLPGKLACFHTLLRPLRLSMAFFSGAAKGQRSVIN